MSFSGDLEHLPIVDVIQLLNSSRKSGTLHMRCPKGECHLGFNNGYIVSAGHLNNVPRIGDILVEMKAIEPEAVAEALAEQKKEGGGRPLIAILIESGRLKKEVAYKGLESLIEMTIVEVLTWTRGTFELDVSETVISDDYRYFPEKLKQDIYVSAQNVLMEALRIYDERKRDGVLKDQDFSDMEMPTADGGVDSGPPDSDITEDILGLDEMDKIERKIPDVFWGLKHEDPAEAHRRKAAEELRDYPAADQEAFVSFLVRYTMLPKSRKDEAMLHEAGATQAVILFSKDELMRYTFTTASKRENFFLFATDDEVNLDLIINQSFSKELVPILVIDSPGAGVMKFSEERITAIRQEKLSRYPQLSVIQFVSPSDSRFPMDALREGVRAVFPRPDSDRGPAFVKELIACLDAFFAYLKKSYTTGNTQMQKVLRECMHGMSGLAKASDVSLAFLRFTAKMFERAVTLAVVKGELVSERGIGVGADRSAGAVPTGKFRIQLDTPSVFTDVVQKGLLFFGHSDDAVLTSRLFGELGAPTSSKIMLAPLKSFGRVIAITYADFGTRAPVPVHTDLLDILSLHASLMLDNIVFQKRFEKPAQPE